MEHPFGQGFSTLSLGMINRNIFKVEISTEPISEERKKELTLQISQQLDIPSLRSETISSLPPASRRICTTRQMTVLTSSTKTAAIKNIAEASDMLNISLLSKKVKKYYLCYQRLHR